MTHALRALLDAITQDDAGRWWVGGPDPEEVCAAAASALDDLEATLKPFAEVGATIPASWSDFHRLEVVDAVDSDSHDFTAADLRAAATALAGKDTAGDVEND